MVAAPIVGHIPCGMNGVIQGSTRGNLVEVQIDGRPQRLRAPLCPAKATTVGATGKILDSMVGPTITITCLRKLGGEDSTDWRR